jgi:hypothetical protein
MILPESIFVGVDAASGRKAFNYAALDEERKLASLGDADLDELTAFLGAHPRAVVAVNAPPRPNKGLVRRQVEKVSLALGKQVRGADLRMVEHELRERGIALAGTPSRPELCPAWMQSGFALYHRLGKMGFKSFPTEDAPHQWLETHPHACFCALLGQVPLPKPTMEGRLQRQLVLHQQGLGIKDPMDFFEEITRHRLLKGILPMELIYSSETLDALVAALVAYQVVHAPEEVMFVGSKEEGRIVLPVKELKEKYGS